MHYELNARDNFIPDRATLKVTFSHPDIRDADITVGDLRGGVVRVAIAIPGSADLGNFSLEVTVPQWIKTSGAMGPEFRWTTGLEVADSLAPKPSGQPAAGRRKGKSGPGDGSLVALMWERHDQVDGWKANTVGSLEMVDASQSLPSRPEYKHLAGLSEQIPTVILNETYAPLKSYIAARSKRILRKTVPMGPAIVMPWGLAWRS